MTKASRTCDAVSMTRVPSFKRRGRRVANSAVASACALVAYDLSVCIL